MVENHIISCKKNKYNHRFEHDSNIHCFSEGQTHIEITNPLTFTYTSSFFGSSYPSLPEKGTSKAVEDVLRLAVLQYVSWVTQRYSAPATLNEAIEQTAQKHACMRHVNNSHRTL